MLMASQGERMVWRASVRCSSQGESWIMGLIHLTRVFTTYVGDMCHWLCSCVRGIELYK
jgi:hypothetical protein